MKQRNLFKLLTAVIIAICTISCTQQPVVIKGKVTNLSPNETIVYYSTVNGSYISWQKYDTLQIQPDSTFSITLPRKEEYVKFLIYDKHILGSVYTIPGTTEINIDASIANDIETVKGAIKENEYLKTLYRLLVDVEKFSFIGGKDVFNLNKDTIASSVYNKIISYSQEIENQLTEVDNTFKTKAIQEIRTEMLYVFTICYSRIYNNVSIPSQEKWNSELTRMAEYVTINHLDNTISYFFYRAIKTYIAILFTKESQPENRPVTNDDYNELYFNNYEKLLTGRIQEHAMINLLIDDTNNEAYSEDIPQLYERFKTIHPKSVWLPEVEKAVAKNIAFNKAEMPEGIHFISSENISNLKDIYNLYAGKVIYIDVWATWCGPCRRAFADIAPLQQYAKDNDIILLYLTIDEESQTSLWKKMVAHYDLKGEHIIKNEALHNEIFQTFGKPQGNSYGLLLPHYAIVNTKGELQFPNAASPKDMNKLTEQLKAAK